ncbi:hypothetical protein WJX81_003755 [Elliptochloris bilobata]|uniref:DUF155 domain-containing protein n=1 Tax=Elliptochloris bilobata TaxID=381761 RepID=A0AAW1SE09_9CHLO
MVAALQQRLQVGDELVEWDEDRIILHPTYHDYQFSAKAFHVGRGLSQQARQLYRMAAERGFPSFWNTAEWRLICLGPRPAAPRESSAAVAGETETGLPYDEPYVAVFENMDTVVFFNGCGNEAQLWQQFAGHVLPTREIEELRVFVRPQMTSESMILADSIGLKAAQPDKIKTIAYLLAQTVALHFYETEVDTMLRAFQDINADMERTGELVAAMAKGELLKMVARNNVMRTGILSSKIGLTKRFDAAWRDAECSRIYEHLREEMEITRRYEDLEVKFDLIQDNLKYFLEIIQNKKSDFLEYLIVILIAAEIFVSLFDMWTRDAFSG